ncbi:MAG: hypothetical protein IPG18_09690 [Saprospiraceae bacterium]|nr:hypothetical protein [Saprospiraceae bacterium]
MKRINKQTLINTTIWTMIIVGIGGLLFLSVQRKKMLTFQELLLTFRQTRMVNSLVKRKSSAWLKNQLDLILPKNRFVR